MHGFIHTMNIVHSNLVGEITEDIFLWKYLYVFVNVNLKIYQGLGGGYPIRLIVGQRRERNLSRFIYIWVFLRLYFHITYYFFSPFFVCILGLDYSTRRICCILLWWRMFFSTQCPYECYQPCHSSNSGMLCFCRI